MLRKLKFEPPPTFPPTVLQSTSSTLLSEKLNALSAQRATYTLLATGVSILRTKPIHSLSGLETSPDTHTPAQFILPSTVFLPEASHWKLPLIQKCGTVR